MAILKGDKGKWEAWNKRFIRQGALAGVVWTFFVLPVYNLIQFGFGADMQSWVLGYFSTLVTHPLYWLTQYGDMFYNNFFGFGMLMAASPLLLAGGIVYHGNSKNPYKKMSEDWAPGLMAKIFDIEEMGLLGGNFMVLGEFSGKLLRFKETLSALCVAPPGTGKTAGIVVPTILLSDHASLVINDVKPELFDITSGYRSTKSFCLRLDWAAEDDPEKGIFYPRWNPLSPLSMPAAGPERDLYIDRLVSVVIPDPKGSADPHWSNKGRAALTGLVQFLASKCEAGNYNNIPEEWRGLEPSFPMLLDWITESLIAANQQIEDLRQIDPNSAMFSDSVKGFLMEAVQECRAGQYSPRALIELTQLANTPEKERGSILSTIDSGLTIFKNIAVRNRTSRSDFSFADLRGMKDPKTGEFKPTTVYICVNQEDAKSLGVITGMFVETLSAYLVANAPNRVDRDGVKLGPMPVIFVLDEFPQMPKLEALIQGPAVGRGQKVSYLMIGQDLGQISGVYGDDRMNTIFSTTAAKIILPLNNDKTAERFQKMLAKKTGKDDPVWGSGTHMFGIIPTKPLIAKVPMSLKDSTLLRVDEFMNTPRGNHFVLMQGYTHRPIYCKTPYYFKNAKFKDLVGKEFGGKYDPAPPMPEFMRKRRLEEEKIRPTKPIAKAPPKPDFKPNKKSMSKRRKAEQPVS